MKLQNILFPSTETATEEELFFRRDIQNTKFTLNENKIVFRDKAKVSFDTYYSSFSLGKWIKYTDLQNLFLTVDMEGIFNLSIAVATYADGKISTESILEQRIECKERSFITTRIQNLNSNGSIIFTLTACEDDAAFYGGWYGTEVNNDTTAVIKIAIGICTFKREKFITHNLELLTKEFIANERSPLFGQLGIYVSDNGKTLDYDALNTDFTHVFPNKNLGGSGGFGRCMYEIYQDKEKKKYSHILLMDDDIIIPSESIYRTYSFLKLLKVEYRDAFLGGAMLCLDKRYIQSEAADYNSMMGHKPVKHKYDLRKFCFVLKNEIEEKVNFFCWWYCVMPIDVINDKNFPIPVFIKYDDKDYGLRNGKTFITLNGILVWHEPFENKKSGFLGYYYCRNTCILNAIHYPEYGKTEIKLQLLKNCVKYSLLYSYKDALLCVCGVQDFLKGVDYLKSLDAEKLHKEITQEEYADQDVKDRDIPFEEVSGKVFKFTRSMQTAAGVLRAYMECCGLIDRRYDTAKKEYNDRYKELINIEFWKKYLFS